MYYQIKAKQLAEGMGEVFGKPREFYSLQKGYALTSHLAIGDAFALGVKSLPRNTFVPEKNLKQIKKDWCNCPEGSESALNWKAYDSEYFFKEHFWPHKDNDLWEPSLGSY